eukprot:CAMPEP_0201574040 /NCGR_PEP_ID=MMETSP0190_2-20130828/18238_1 /ASSEMBLY_ACC=CAM_ASM_000263 /TAXON_ID=37353 /ORGANISM="Rosalina sp." /LENGTH=236 /DNA_ID=CAMNT_0048001713 /DNA_START=65 /DNA_END=775 /DNA_ORIENTATION=+
MKYLINGYLKRDGFHESLFIVQNTENTEVITKSIVAQIIKFCQYTLKPLSSSSRSSHHKKKSHRKKNSSRISTKSHRSSEKRSSDKRHSRRTSSRISTKSDKKNSEKRGLEKRKSSKSRRKSSKIKKKKNKDKDKEKDKDSDNETDRTEKKRRRSSKKRRKPSKISKSNEMYTIHENLANNISTNTGSPSIQLPVIDDYGSIPKLGMAQSSNASSLMDHYEGYDIVIEGSDNNPMI